MHISDQTNWLEFLLWLAMDPGCRRRDQSCFGLESAPSGGLGAARIRQNLMKISCKESIRGSFWNCDQEEKSLSIILLSLPISQRENSIMKFLSLLLVSAIAALASAASDDAYTMRRGARDVLVGCGNIFISRRAIRRPD